MALTCAKLQPMTEERSPGNLVETAVEFDHRDTYLIQGIVLGMIPSEIESKYGIGKLTQNYRKWKIAQKFDEEKDTRIGLYKAIAYTFREDMINIPSDIIPSNPSEPFADHDLRELVRVIEWIKLGLPADEPPRDQPLRAITHKIMGKKSSNYVAFGWILRYMRESGQL